MNFHAQGESIHNQGREGSLNKIHDGQLSQQFHLNTDTHIVGNGDITYSSLHFQALQGGACHGEFT